METNILIIDDSSDDYALIEKSIYDSGITATVFSAQDGIIGYGS